MRSVSERTDHASLFPKRAAVSCRETVKRPVNHGYHDRWMRRDSAIGGSSSGNGCCALAGARTSETTKLAILGASSKDSVGDHKGDLQGLLQDCLKAVIKLFQTQADSDQSSVLSTRPLGGFERRPLRHQQGELGVSGLLPLQVDVAYNCLCGPQQLMGLHGSLLFHLFHMQMARIPGPFHSVP
jgi:hypothetical protein